MKKKPLRWGARLAAALVVLAAPLIYLTRAEAAVATLVGTGVTAPGGAVWVPGGLGGHWWISDHIQGFCRLDMSGSSLVVNASTCSLVATSPGQPAFDAAANVVYVPDNSAKSVGVVRLSFNSVSETVLGAVVLAPGKGLGGNRPTAVALAGGLYVSFLKNGSIVRITDPGGDPAAQVVQSVGGSSDGKRVLSVAALGSDLYLAEGAAVSRIVNVSSCAGGCRGVAVNTGAAAPMALTVDATRVFVGDTSAVLRYSPDTNTADVLANTGTSGGTVYPLSNVSTLAVDPSGTLLIGDDPTAGAGVLTGRLWTANSNA